MKSITSKLLAAIGSIAILFSLLLFYAAYTQTRNRTYEVIGEQAAMALKFDLAIRSYVGNHIRPVLYDLIGEDDFILEAMSTSYAARSIFEDVRTEFPDYIIKFSSDNPRNPINQAGPEEMEIITLFNQTPDLKRWEGTITIQGKPYMAKFNARRMETSCALCHGDPADAPASIIEKYGPAAGFNRPMGRVIGMDMVAIPLTRISQQFWKEMGTTFIASLMGLLIFFVSIVMVIKHLVINRLATISGHFDRAAGESDYSKIPPIYTRGNDEISDLAMGFNTLSQKLKESYAALDKKVKDRTQTLEIVNQQLSQEIRERRKTEKALRDSEERFRTLHNASFGGIAIHDGGIILDCNQGLSQLTGYDREELIGMNGMALIAPDFRNQTLKKVYTESDRPYEVEGVRKDGTIYPLRIHAQNIPYRGRTVRVTEMRDITESRRAEEEKISAQKVAGEQKQLALVGQVAGKIAHDFNNILGIVMGNAELSLRHCSDEKIKKRLSLIFQQTQRGKNLTRNLVAFAKSQDPKQDFFNIKDKIDLVLNLLKKDLDGIRVVRKDEAGTPELLADPGMIEHALVNLLINAVHALSKTDAPEIVVQTWCKEDQIFIEIRDNGCGIPAEHLDRIYEPSFTLKGSRDKLNLYGSEIRGTGYGMANVKKYVRQHKGRITVSSQLDKGTVFTLSFPVIRKKLSRQEKQTVKQGLIHTSKQILLVEDEPAISGVQKTILTQAPCRHKVDTADSVAEAVALFDTNPYDLVSLDYILAGNGNGMDVYTHIRESDAKTPILFVSGNIEFLESLKPLTRKDTLAGHISKPCMNTEYLEAVNRMLDRRGHKV
ncbi:MAG: DUF3365 domain-containing protein [Desulfobacter sp.]|nr:MAG: DUF3365 domain-containing protein [Desulfobacter sp.]